MNRRLLVVAFIGGLWPLFAPSVAAFFDGPLFAGLALLPFLGESTIPVAHRISLALISTLALGILVAATLVAVARHRALLTWLVFVCSAFASSFLLWPLDDRGFLERVTWLRESLAPATWLGPFVVGVFMWLLVRRRSEGSARVAP